MKKIINIGLIATAMLIAKPLPEKPGTGPTNPVIKPEKPESEPGLPVEPKPEEPITVPGQPSKSFVDVLIMPITGALLLPGLVIGDAQWQFHTNRNNCDTRHFIYTIVPTPKNREKFGISVKVPCSAWFEKK